MNTAQPIRDKQELKRFTGYYRDIEKNPRNYLLIVMGVNTALRISDLLRLQWKDIYDEGSGSLREHVTLVEEKTQKTTCIYLNEKIQKAVCGYVNAYEKESGRKIKGEQFLFHGKGTLPISRIQAYRIIRKCAEKCRLSGTISPHSLRKTFGYHAWKQGVSPALLMEIYQHSSFAITKRYLGIDQDDRDEVFKNICL